MLPSYPDNHISLINLKRQYTIHRHTNNERSNISRTKTRRTLSEIFLTFITIKFSLFKDFLKKIRFEGTTSLKFGHLSKKNDLSTLRQHLDIVNVEAYLKTVANAGHETKSDDRYFMP